MLKDVERDLEGTNHRAEASTEKCRTENKATFKYKGDNGRWFHVDASIASVEVLLPTPITTENAQLVGHIKQEG